MAGKQKESMVIEVIRLERKSIEMFVLGRRPLIMNRLSEKTKRELLLPKGRKTAADKVAGLKHNPSQEFQNSPHILRDEDAPTLLAMPSTAFKGAIREAALRVPGAKKTEIGQLVFVPHDYVPIYGIPKMFFSSVRSADMNKTPDIRMRAIIPEWAAIVPVEYVSPNLVAATVLNLGQAAGTVIGVGDWRPEKGKGDYGQFEVVDGGNPQLTKIIKSDGRSAQKKAMANPSCYDEETADLLAWYNAELKRLGRSAA